jgi:hypothetical protein
MFVHHTLWHKLPEVIVDIMEDEEGEEEEAEEEVAVALAKATLWKSSNRSHVWCRTHLAAAVITSILFKA